MRKPKWVPILALVLAATVALAAGCGGSAKKEELKKRLATAGRLFSEGQSYDATATDLGENIRNKLIDEGTLDDARVIELKTVQSQVDAKMNQALTDYREVADTPGAGNYGTYASLLATASEQYIEFSKKKLEYVMLFVNAFKNPATTDSVSLETKIEALQNEITRMSKEVEATVQDSTDLSSEKKLF